MASKSPFTIQIFYPDGESDNMRIAEKRNWTGKVLYISRDYWSEGKNKHKDKLKTPGVYILIGRDEGEDDDDDLQTIYIGQAGNLLNRIESHFQNSEMSFWSNVVCATGGGNFNDAHFRWAESHLIKQARAIDRCSLANGNTPNKPQISEAEEVDVAHFLEEALQIFSIFEIDAFDAPKTLSKPNIHGKSKPKNESEQARFGQKERVELMDRVLASFQSRNKVKLFKRSQATFYDESKTIHVCCGISKNFPDKKRNSYWFTPSVRWFNFLENGNKGYLLLGMENQSKAVALSFQQFNEIKDRFGTTEKGEALWWHVVVNEQGGSFYFKLKGRERIDASSYLFVID